MEKLSNHNHGPVGSAIEARLRALDVVTEAFPNEDKILATGCIGVGRTDGFACSGWVVEVEVAGESSLDYFVAFTGEIERV